jgi:hypothetical protein
VILSKCLSADSGTGVKSIARQKILDGQDVPPRLAGFAAYRATVPAGKMLADPDIAWLVEKPTLNCWYDLPESPENEVLNPIGLAT